RVLSLDEATSALDNETEQEVMEAIDGLHGTRTLIVIAHRLSTIKKCDRIYEVENGVFVEKRKEKVLEKR
ncbi:MAG: ABC transporter ATP-binding protein, partial [Lachnospiraceae bacterium]|nr:ABC transporter ATP-binding protein [Lachnospiraceae bacterium]